MKKLKNLQINPDKLMKNAELITLKGGYDGCNYHLSENIIKDQYGLKEIVAWGVLKSVFKNLLTFTILTPHVGLIDEIKFICVGLLMNC